MTIIEERAPAPPMPPPRPRLRLDWSAVIAAVLATGGLAYRVWLLAYDLPPTNSDEATMGLAALHISAGREFPAFFYGQAYMGTLEAYLAVPLFWLFGPSIAALRLPALLLYAGFLAGTYALTRRLYTPWLAVVTVGALALGADRIVKNQLITAGGYPEISPAAVALLLLSVALGTGAVRRRPSAFAGWGLLVGLLVWNDWLALPYVAAAGAVLVIACWPDLRRPDRRGLAWAAAVGFVVGAAPLLIHNFTGPLSQNSLSVFLNQTGSTGTTSLAERLYGGVVVGIPLGTGLCGPSHCAPWQLWWAVPFLGLLAAAGVLAVRGLRRGGTADDRVRELARLGLVGAAALSVAMYARSSAAALTPVESARYLSCLLISLPAVLWPLWSAAVRLDRRTRLAAVAAAAPIAALLAGMLVATAGLVAEARNASRRAQAHHTLADYLVRQGVNYIYSDYWTCNLITFDTRERVICAVIADDLRPGLDRYAPYRSKVAAAERPAYVVPVSLELDARLAGALRSTGIPYEVIAVAGYHVYLPERRAPLPAG